MGAKDLGEILSTLPSGEADPNLLVGTQTADDAAVYRLTPEMALVQTVDYITPLVDDPYQFGQIAATNSISDVYAMGGQPLLALNIVAFPTETLPLAVLGEVLRGGADKAREAGVRIIGGHSIDDREPKYGLAVTGIIHPDRIVRNSTARVGDRLVLTKPLGTGIIATAIKRDLAAADVVAGAVRVMTTLNKGAAAAALDVGVDACTDITGFGLLGHLHEMALGSGVAARIAFQHVPVLDGVPDLVAQGIVPGGTKRNLAYVEAFVTFGAAVDAAARLILADAQTSGGLLLAVAPERVNALTRLLERNGVPVVAEIGEIIAGVAGRIEVGA